MRAKPFLDIRLNDELQKELLLAAKDVGVSPAEFASQTVEAALASRRA